VSGQDQLRVCPPSTLRMWPVMKEASSATVRYFELPGIFALKISFPGRSRLAASLTETFMPDSNTSRSPACDSPRGHRAGHHAGAIGNLTQGPACLWSPQGSGARSMQAFATTPQRLGKTKWRPSDSDSTVLMWWRLTRLTCCRARLDGGRRKCGRE
jgi:hypothetical protein